RLIEHRLPLDARREGRPAAPAQTGSRDRLHDGRRLHGQCPGQPLVTAVRHIIRDARGVDETDALEGQTLLTLEPGDLLGGSEGQSVRATVEEVGVEKAADVAGLSRPRGAAS